MRPLVLCDFDGTIITRDSCVELSSLWARGIDWEALEEEWQMGTRSTAEVARRILDSVETPLSVILDHLQTIPLRSGFPEFVAHCASAKIPLLVVSDGYEVIIRRILAAGRFDLPLYANILYQDGPRLAADFPHASPRCTRCGCCKKTILERLRHNPGPHPRPVILIGDGRSDTCAAALADTVFACGRLPQLCQEAGISYTGFSDFFDLIRHPAFSKTRSA